MGRCNDSQLIFYDQFVPGSTLVAYLNADHWAIGVPIARTHRIFGTYLVDDNSFPREAMYESLMRLIEEDLQVKDTAFTQQLLTTPAKDMSLGNLNDLRTIEN